MQRGLGLAKAKSKDDVDLPLQSAECSLRMLLWLAALECCRLQGRPMAPTGVGAGIRPASGPRDLGCGPVPPPPKSASLLTCPLPPQCAELLVLMTHLRARHRDSAGKSPAIFVPYTLPPQRTFTPSRFASRDYPRPSRARRRLAEIIAEPLIEALPCR